MNHFEFLAMVDERLSDGRRYPTLEEYGAALREVGRQEAEAAQIGMQQSTMNALMLQNASQQAMNQQAAANMGIGAADASLRDLFRTLGGYRT